MNRSVVVCSLATAMMIVMFFSMFSSLFFWFLVLKSKYNPIRSIEHWSHFHYRNNAIYCMLFIHQIQNSPNTRVRACEMVNRKIWNYLINIWYRLKILFQMFFFSGFVANIMRTPLPSNTSLEASQSVFNTSHSGNV